MNEPTLDVLDDVVGRLERAIHARDCPAIVVVQGERTLTLSDFDYLRDQETAEAFERRVADHARRIRATRWVFAVPQVWLRTPEGVASRAVSNHPLREGEQEAITWTAFDITDGVDYGLVPYTRRPNGEPVFGDAEVFTGNLIPGERAPGYTLLRILMSDEDDGLSPSA
ncbi:hypothetical protein [Streptomyces specialis]|uniref:hypothetical protein n=1 Tax=Streptomyces specialis TaxID=498367 RepID=UPI00073E1FD2|nr:hypothetical protein [Streptomyces specialis]